ncbi:MAG: hypothetical protein ACLSDQ_02645 [Adlercreutzia equolifaciens]
MAKVRRNPEESMTMPKISRRASERGRPGNGADRDTRCRLVERRDQPGTEGVIRKASP